MKISDMLGQYNRNVHNGTEELQSVRGMQKMVSSVAELEVGNIFEGTVNSIRGGKVLLALGNGQMLTAQMDGKVSIQPGTAMFFQVKSNDGETVAIRPYNAGNAGNPILLDALTTAGIPATERTFVMVDAMMQEQMSVGKQSLLDMVRILNANPEVKVTTLVQMTKLGIPVNAANAAQFENYMADSHAIIKEMSAAVEQITSVFVNEEMTGEEAYAVNNRILDILSQEVPQAAAAVEKALTPGENTGLPGTVLAEGTPVGEQRAVLAEKNASGEPGAVPPEKNAAGGPGTVLPEKNIMIPQDILPEGESAQVQAGMAPGSENSTTPQGAVSPEVGAVTQQDVEMPEGAVLTEGNAGAQPLAATEEKGIAVQRQPVVTGELLQLASRTAPLTGEPLSGLFTEEQLTHLTRALQSVPALAADETLFPNLASDETFVDTMTEQEQPVGFSQAVLNRELDAGTFLMAVRRALTENSHYGFSGVQKLFAGREYRAALENVMEQQWLLKPEELRQEKRVSQLYNRLDSQMQQMERLLRASGAEQQNFTAAATEVRSNIEFMNQVNQIYNYIQIPLKMSGQNASSELYVYTNRKSLQDPEGELTAFLHLDMENLGSTDVSIRLKNKNVHTDFYLEDDASYDLVEKHLPILEKHLKNKGYLCKVTVTRERTESANFVENVREKDKAATGTLHRYSFDVKA